MQDPIDPFALAAEFIDAFDASTDIELWYKLIREELDETIEAMEAYNTNGHVPGFCQVLKEFSDLNYVMCGAVITAERHNPDSDIPVDLLGGFTEVAHAIQGVVSGVDLLEAFRRVHVSNMSKLGEDGKPVRREDGKILKGPNYSPPDLTDVALKVLRKLGGVK